MDFNMLNDLPNSVFDVYANIDGDENIIEDIISELDVFDIPLNAEERRQYNFNPKQLAFSIYGDVCLWYILLRVNGMSHPSELSTLTKPSVKLPTKNSLDKVKKTLYKYRNTI